MALNADLFALPVGVLAEALRALARDRHRAHRLLSWRQAGQFAGSTVPVQARYDLRQLARDAKQAQLWQIVVLDAPRGAQVIVSASVVDDCHVRQLSGAQSLGREVDDAQR